MRTLACLAIAFGVFYGLLAALWAFWYAILVGLLGGLWDRMPAAEVVGPALLGFAVLSGLGLYYFALSRALAAYLGSPPRQIALRTAAIGSVPALSALALGWFVVSSMRLGF